MAFQCNLNFPGRTAVIFGWNTWSNLGYFGILWQNRICDHWLTLPSQLTIDVNSTDFHSLSSIFFERSFKIDFFFFFQFLVVYHGTVLPTLFDEISPRDWIFLAKIANPQKRQIFNFCNFKNRPKSPIFPKNLQISPKITHFSLAIFTKKVVPNLKPKIEDLAKNRHSWQHWLCCKKIRTFH